MSNLLFIFMSFVLSYGNDATNSFVNGDKTYVASEVDKLRDGVLNTKLQLQMFQEIIKSEGINRYYPKLIIGFRNDLTERYKIFSVEYIIDGVKTFFYQADIEGKSGRKTASVDEEVKDFSTTISPGKHTVQVVVSFVGNDSGIFSYLSEYKVQVTEDKHYDFEKNNDYKLSVRTYEHGGLLTGFKDKAKLEVALTKMVR
jgi:hypothetical protein